MKDQKKVIFVQGYGDYSDGVWPGWLEKELKKVGFDYLSIEIPDPMFPDIQEWLRAMRRAEIIVDENTYFVGHSLGCMTIVRYLAGLDKKVKAGGCVFVAGFCEFPNFPLIGDFCALPLDWEQVKKRAREFFVVLSDNDTMVSVSSGQEFAKKLGAEVIIEKKKGHFKTDVKEIPSVLNAILEMDQMREELAEIKKLKTVK